MDPALLNSILPWIREIGLPGMILVIWYFDHRRISDLENFVGAFKRLTLEAGEREKCMLEVIQMNVACLSRLEQKISDNTFCPIVRREGGK